MRSSTLDQRTIKLPEDSFEKLIIGRNMPDPIIEQLLISIPDDLEPMAEN
jgi:hypothetical protein